MDRRGRWEVTMAERLERFRREQRLQVDSEEESDVQERNFTHSMQAHRKGTPRPHLPLQCPVCLCAYSRKQRPPLVLPACGHSVCSVCLKRQFTLKCPVCYMRSQQVTSNLPVNFVLLEVAEMRARREICLKHEAEIVAVCADDEALLCGICLFEHKGHNSFLLNSPEAAQIAATRKSQVSHYETELEHAKTTGKAQLPNSMKPAERL